VSGYSGTPLAQKLGIRAGSRLFASGAPENYASLLAPLPERVQRIRRMAATTDLAHIFVTRRAQLARALAGTRKLMRADAALWISWPKKASGVATDVTEDLIRELALPLGFVDIKVCAVDHTWSGLKLVIRRELRPAAAKAAKGAR
jgi:hypothetical protein